MCRCHDLFCASGEGEAVEEIKILMKVNKFEIKNDENFNDRLRMNGLWLPSTDFVPPRSDFRDSGQNILRTCAFF